MTRMPVEVVEQVFERDRGAIRQALFGRGEPPWYAATLHWFGDRLQFGDEVVCPAIVIDRKQLGKCFGRWTIDHVNEQSTRGKRAPSDLGHCISLCEGHTEPGMKAGFIWNTAHRPQIREYLKGANQ